MPSRLPHLCEDMAGWLGDDQQSAVGYSRQFREYFINIPGAQSVLIISYCPWCGAQLPESVRDEWFDRAEALGEPAGFDPDDPEVPPEMWTDEWWISAGL